MSFINQEAQDFISASNTGMSLEVDEGNAASNTAARENFTESSISGGATNAPIDTGNSFMSDVFEGAQQAFTEMGSMMGSGSRVSPMRASSGTMPRSSAPQVFRGSTGNIAQILKMFSPYQGGM